MKRHVETSLALLTTTLNELERPSAIAELARIWDRMNGWLDREARWEREAEPTAEVTDRYEQWIGVVPVVFALHEAVESADQAQIAARLEEVRNVLSAFR